MSEEKVGKVVKFFTKPSVAAIEVTGGTIKIGDTVLFKGHTTDFQEMIDSMQVDNVSVDKAETGQLVGIKVKDRVRGGDIVYKVSAEN